MGQIPVAGRLAGIGQSRFPTPREPAGFLYFLTAWGQPMNQGNRKPQGSSNAVVSGTIHLIEETKTYGAKGFRKRVVVLEQDLGKFTNYIPLEFIQDACDSVDDVSVGDQIEVTYRLSGRRWQKDPSSEAKYFLSAEALEYRLMSGGAANKGVPAPKSGSRDPNMAFSEAADEAGDADVPF